MKCANCDRSKEFHIDEVCNQVAVFILKDKRIDKALIGNYFKKSWFLAKKAIFAVNYDTLSICSICNKTNTGWFYCNTNEKVCCGCQLDWFRATYN